ncbi:PGF-CTERM-anchored ABC transporter substrate-binding protein [Halobacterium sp. KA-4]|uniref:PGF-CTERM-anchored ABC transporter substrate-binding protein n=1 Tax=Halobacterium sp. KA-4 TaxID=2896367 RepID=UPI001E340B4A|nr:PGF-CTERM-anchored ABC transporter substrate-binding protein [Halobacterium sp. KA-4]MCD2201604.1 PGF-CTERM-anchored ABC transporter substrate-binding protein [Halobacterium sp. KA-4]
MMNRRLPVLFTTILILATVAPGLTAAAPATTTNTQALECSFPLEQTDASGHDVTLNEEPQRIVTLNPSAAQTMWELGAREKVVGVSQFAGFLDGAESREVVTSGFPSSVEVEKVISLDPDLVLAPNTIPDDSVTQLRDAGVTVYRFAMAASIEDIYQKTKTIGQLTGACSGADATVTEMQTDIQTIEAAVEGAEQPSVFYDMGDHYTAGPNTFIGGILAKAGGHNIVANTATEKAYPQLSAEVILEQDPEFLVLSAPPSQLGNDPKSYIGEDSVLRETTAFKQGNIVVVDTNHISQPAPRVVDVMVQLTKAFHPDAYADANLDEITDQDDSTIGPTTYSHTIVDNQTIRLDTHLNYFDEQTANFSIPTSFTNDSNPQLTSVRVTPREPNWQFGVTATKLDSNVTLPDSATALAGYQFTPHGMWPDSLETLSVTATLNTTQLNQNTSTDDLTAYTKQNGNWTQTDIHTNRTNETITLRVDTSSYPSLYFATTATETAQQPTPTTTTQPTTTAETTTTQTTQQPATTTSAATSTETTTTTTGTTIPGFTPTITLLSLLLVSLGLYGKRRH